MLSPSTLCRTAAAFCALAATSGAQAQLRNGSGTSRAAVKQRVKTPRTQLRQSANPKGYRFATDPARPYQVSFIVDWAKLGLRPQRGFTFDFGDGQRAPVRPGAVEHNYRSTVDHREPRNRFHTQLIDPQGKVVAERVLTVGSSIAMSRQMGFAQAEMNPPSAQALSCPARTEVVITNHEAERVGYERFLRRFQPCDPTQKAFVQDTDLQTAVGRQVGQADGQAGRAVLGRHGDRGRDRAGRLILEPGASMRLNFDVPCEKTVDMCVVSWTLVGRTERGMPAYADFHAEVNRNPFRLEEIQRFRSAFLNELVETGLVRDPTVIDASTLHQLALDGRIVQTPTGWEVVK